MLTAAQEEVDEDSKSDGKYWRKQFGAYFKDRGSCKGYGFDFLLCDPLFQNR